jgi:hypothetical protein
VNHEHSEARAEVCDHRGVPGELGLIVEVVYRLGPCAGYRDGYRIRTVSDRPFAQLRMGGELRRGTSNVCLTERHKLRPLVEDKDEADQEGIRIKQPDEPVLA